MKSCENNLVGADMSGRTAETSSLSDEMLSCEVEEEC